MEYPKPKTYDNEDYLIFIRGKPCRICLQRAEPHHVRRIYWGAGTSKKPHDYVSIPRCRRHHGPDFEDNVELEIISLLMEYIESKRRGK